MEREPLHKCVKLPPLFNNENLLEFSIEPDKRWFVPGKSYLQFFVELPEEFVPDNNFANKVWSFLHYLCLIFISVIRIHGLECSVSRLFLEVVQK